jgi:hypothetical protein
VTGLIKTILMLEREQILPNSGFETPNKRIPLDKWNLHVFEVKTHSELNVNSNVDSHEVLSLDSQEWGFEGIN